MSIIKLDFLGGADTVTGSRTLLQVNNHKYLIDCGLFQGAKDMRQRNWRAPTFNPAEINSIFLTHAHLDHSGYLPKLVKEGFQGRIFCSNGTYDLAKILLKDAAYLEEEGANYANISGYSNHKPALPLFTTDDVETAIKHLQPLPDNDWRQIDPFVSVRLLRAGHIIGARIIQLSIKADDQKSILLTFSGDLGHNQSKIMRGPVELLESDYIVLESTYGDRLHPREDPLKELAELIHYVNNNHGVLLIPAFAVGRAQEILYLINLLETDNLAPKLPVFLDSPMANAATRIFLDHGEDHILGSSFLEGEKRSLFPEKFQPVNSVDQSMQLCHRPGPFIVISASGMLNGGRILHHLKCRLPDRSNVLLFTGFQAEGTKGRFLQDNFGRVASLRIHHQETAIGCRIENLESLSAHADYHDEIKWLSAMSKKPQMIIVNHGTESSQKNLAKLIESQLQIKTLTAFENHSVTLFKK